MSSIVELIDDIAARINLLALNATIESGARRGKRAAASLWSPPR